MLYDLLGGRLLAGRSPRGFLASRRSLLRLPSFGGLFGLLGLAGST